MSVAYFILVVTAISFATGLFVAFIIWVIKWSIISRENHETSGVLGFSQFLADLSSVRNKSEQLALSGNRIPFLSRIFSGSDGNKTGNDSSNKELYRYYHGSATQEKTEDLKPKSSTGNNYLNKELYNYYHGEN